MIRAVPKPKKRIRLPRKSRILNIESNPLEDTEQLTVIEWLQAHKLDFTAIVPDRKKCFRLGYQKGFPDIIVTSMVPGMPLIRGVAIEMKRRKGGVISPDQWEWYKKLTKNNWAFIFSEGCDEALRFLELLFGREGEKNGRQSDGTRGTRFVPEGQVRQHHSTAPEAQQDIKSSSIGEGTDIWDYDEVGVRLPRSVRS